MNTQLSEMVMARINPHMPPSLVPPSTLMSSMFLYRGSCFKIEKKKKKKKHSGMGNGTPYLASPMKKVIIYGFLQKEKEAKTMD
ncbi:hypothetical protein D8674_000351 [Pyrus ussuriensis x Pyrus communis]|uniref:Uncharacterized protein n=1 Tax=Pyrus ussuriensis x Pyrus communis TaxID=2448454 RepID=A0A5N5F5S4_9ROSA|nr:hypothetical protein D8674_000351 [Pyrus ussuriensis x Pyrus communis]